METQLFAAASSMPVMVQHAPPLTIQNLPKVEIVDSGWAIFAAIASAMAAFASGVVAVFTSRLASSTRDLSRQTALLASETKKVAAETAALAKETVESISVARETIVAEDRRHVDQFMPHVALLVWLGIKEFQPGIRRSWLVLSAKNIGAGLAWNISAMHHNGPNQQGLVVSNPPIALGAGDEVELVRRSDESHVDLMGYSMTYEDSFGNRFESSIENRVLVGSRYAWRRLP